MTLDKLRDAPAAAWLWDAARGRIVWANAAGVVAFEGQSLFDLIDRPFDIGESGVAAIAELAGRLVPEQAERVDLAFPSVGKNDAFACEARLHALGDGRPGVLIVEWRAPEPVVVAATETAKPDFNAFDMLPAAVTMLDASGTFQWSNTESRKLLGDATSLSGILSVPGRSEALLKRLENVELVSGIEKMNGEREVRITLRRSSPQIIAMLEDVTERRQVERALASAVPPPVTQSALATPVARPHLLPVERRAPEAIAPKALETVEPPKPAKDAFAELAHELKQTIKRNGNGSAAPPQTTSPEPIPALIRKTLEASGQALVIVSDETPVYANEKLAKLFGKSSGAELLADEALALRLRALPGQAEFAMSFEGTVGNLQVKRSDVPWQGGPALQYVFSEMPTLETQARIIPFPEAATQQLRPDTSPEASAPPAGPSWNLDQLGKLSHELRTPLTSIIGFAEIIRSERFGPLGNAQYKAYVNDIHDSGTHLLSLVNDILDLSRLSAGQAEMNFSAVDLVEIAESSVRMLQAETDKANLRLILAMPEKLPRVVADYRAVRQILTNLISNAIKYTDAGGTVTVSAGVNERGELSLIVADTGIGMTVAEIQSAQEPFRRIETAGRYRPGAGIGLPVAKSLTEANRARFEVVSAPKAGTRISIVFPTTRVLVD